MASSRPTTTERLVRCEFTADQRDELVTRYHVGFALLNGSRPPDDGNGHPILTRREFSRDDSDYLARGTRVGRAITGLQVEHWSPEDPDSVYVLEGDRDTLSYISTCVATSLIAEGQSPFGSSAEEEPSPGLEVYRSVIDAALAPQR